MIWHFVEWNASWSLLEIDFNAVMLHLPSFLTYTFTQCIISLQSRRWSRSHLCSVHLCNVPLVVVAFVWVCCYRVQCPHFLTVVILLVCLYLNYVLGTHWVLVKLFFSKQYLVQSVRCRLTEWGQKPDYSGVLCTVTELMFWIKKCFKLLLLVQRETF